ncbi:MAG: hypothetical protein KF712_14235 [Akkermansiaceae bacterium]|nr:hypothetical protein [Akkermansiaceae bacterium]
MPSSQCETNPDETEMESPAEFEAIADRFPETGAKLTTFPSGNMMLDLVIDGVDYCAEYFSTNRIYGLSRTAGFFRHSLRGSTNLSTQWMHSSGGLMSCCVAANEALVGGLSRTRLQFGSSCENIDFQHTAGCPS